MADWTTTLQNMAPILGGIGADLSAGRPIGQGAQRGMLQYRQQQKDRELEELLYGKATPNAGQGIVPGSPLRQGGILSQGDFTPQQRGILQAVGPRAAAGILAQQAFAEPAAGPAGVQEYEYAKGQGYGGSFMDYQRDKAEAGRAPGQPQGARSAIAKLAQDFRDGFIDKETFEASRQKILSGDNGITVSPDGTIQIGGSPRDVPTAVRTEIEKGRNAYQSISKGLDDYEALVQAGGTAVIPGKYKDSLLVARRNLQLQMKELYNLGVLNGPDLELMDQLIVDATDLGNVALDATGISDFRERNKSNMAQLRKAMKDLIEPKLRSIGEGVPGAPDDQPDLTSMSDDELMALRRRLSSGQ